MNLSLGVFDIFAYSVPGSLYLALLLYVLDRESWVDLGQVGDLNSTVLVGGGILASYLLGHLTYAPRRFLGRRMPRWLRPGGGTRQEFLDRFPVARSMAFVQVDPAIIFAAIEVKAPDSAGEISRLRASGIALRNAGFALLLAAGVATVELVADWNRGLPAFCLAVFLVGFVGATRAGHELSRWAALKTLEVAFWLPDIEAELAARSPVTPPPPPRPAPPPPRPAPPGAPQ
ncbi:hypothetical protein [Pseudofrankia inefficax]|uniref:Uncharacterized protein n=1 Tax=Pseudofrankia inefficax (strain DSM 45817 / CECT 9037 / DDB 130130 / EuI1c) TaxID=298654 RepID=E3JD03_PSEI1|nr:hypothetical protein [Pseudofrankia inefficax]ADP81142.1 hypothetical protein FraEuI1c_3122 [Pseudofrankia inefficax]